MKKNHMLRTILLSTVFALLALVLIPPVVSAHEKSFSERRKKEKKMVKKITSIYAVAIVLLALAAVMLVSTKSSAKADSFFVDRRCSLAHLLASTEPYHGAIQLKQNSHFLSSPSLR